MCGILGVFGKNAANFKENIEKGLGVLYHRGPDGKGLYISTDQNCILGHVRLAIQDPSENARQPFLTSQSCLSYNGEIYNHFDLRQEINNNEYRTKCDTETLQHGLDEYGIRFLNRVEGMFAGAFYGFSSQNLTLFCDGLGIKSLYYFYPNREIIVFCSEIKGIFEIFPEAKRELNVSAFGKYVNYENVSEGETLFSGVQRLKVGEVQELTIGDHGVIQESLSHIEFEYNPGFSEPRSFDEWKSVLNKELHRSVKNHMISDRPLGVYMSGGVDSTLVASLAVKHKKDIVGYTGYFRGRGEMYDERLLARLAAKHIGLKELVEVEIGPQCFVDHFDNLMFSLDEPKMGMGSFSQYMVAKKIAEKDRVVLAGHGGDELFAGYPQFKAFYLLNSETDLLSRLKSLLTIKCSELPWIAYALKNRVTKNKLFFAPNMFGEKIRGKNPFEGSVEVGSSISQLNNYYHRLYLPGLLSVEDKVSMAFSLETRVPIWTQRIEKVASTIPLKIKMREGKLKSLLKEVAVEHLPIGISRGPKRGFPTPLRHWFRGALKDFLFDRLDNPNDFVCQKFGKEKVQKLIPDELWVTPSMLYHWIAFIFDKCPTTIVTVGETFPSTRAGP